MSGVYNIYVTMLHFDVDSFTVIFYHLIVYKLTYVCLYIIYELFIHSVENDCLLLSVSSETNKVYTCYCQLLTLTNCYLHSEMFSWLQFYVFFIVSVWLGTVMTAYSWSYNSWESDRPVSRLNSVSAQSTEALDWAETSECYP